MSLVNDLWHENSLLHSTNVQTTQELNIKHRKDTQNALHSTKNEGTKAHGFPQFLKSYSGLSFKRDIKFQKHKCITKC